MATLLGSAIPSFLAYIHQVCVIINESLKHKVEVDYGGPPLFCPFCMVSVTFYEEITEHDMLHLEERGVTRRREDPKVRVPHICKTCKQAYLTLNVMACSP